MFKFGDVCFGIGERHLFWFVPHHEVEWRVLLDGVGSLVVGKFCGREKVFPVFGVVGAEDVEVNLYFLVYPFCFSIGLRVISGAHGQFNTEYSPKFLE